jgi:hypothetical protein
MFDHQSRRVLVLKYAKRRKSPATVNDAIARCGGPADGFRQETLGLRAKQGGRKCICEGRTGVLVTTKAAVTPAACEGRPYMYAGGRCQAQLPVVGELTSMQPMNDTRTLIEKRLLFRSRCNSAGRG